MQKKSWMLIVGLFFTIGCLYFEPVYITTAQDIHEERIGSSLYQMESIYAEQWLLINGFGKHQLSNPKELMSVKDEIAAVLFEINEGGYIVINLYNYDILEYSADNRPDLINCNKVVYNGFRQFYTEDKDRLIGVIDGYEIRKADLNCFFDKVEKYDYEKILYKTEQMKKNCSELEDGGQLVSKQVRAGYEYGNLSHSLQTWNSPFYCQIDSAAILLKYLDDHKNSQFLPYGIDQYLTIHGYLNSGYINNYCTSSDQVVYGGLFVETVYYKGMIEYLTDHCLYGYSVTCTNYNFNTIKNQINNNYPVVCASERTVPGATWNEKHAYVVHGYQVGYDGIPYISVNDTFGYNNIIINASAYYHSLDDYMWYIC